MKKKSTIRIKMVLAFISYNLIFASILAPFVVFWGPFESLKVMAVGAVATSRHPQVVQAFLSQAEIDRIMNLNADQGMSGSLAIDRTNVISNISSGITIEDIKGASFKGKVMLDRKSVV